MNRGLIEGLLDIFDRCPEIVLPRFMNRGLIEGRSDSRSKSSADSLPRFMNRGLIEGRLLTAGWRRPFHFPDS